MQSAAQLSVLFLLLSHFSDYNRGLSKTQGLGVSQNDKMHVWIEGAAHAFFRCVRTPDVLAILQHSLIRVFQIVLFIGRTL